MLADRTAERELSRLRRRYSAFGTGGQIAILVCANLLALLSDFYLVHTLLSARGPIGMPRSFWVTVMAVVQLLP